MFTSRDVMEKLVSFVLLAECGDIVRIVEALSITVVHICVADIVMKCAVDSSAQRSDDLSGTVDSFRRVLST